MEKTDSALPDLRLDAWLLEHVCGFWATRIVDGRGGFFEKLDAVGKPITTVNRGVLTQARLTYVFSHAYVLSRDEKLLHAAEHGFDFLFQTSPGAESEDGWPHISTSDGQVVDESRDAYDHAFIIFSMAWYYRATGKQQAISLAEGAYGYMEKYLTDALNGGFFEEGGVQKLPRRQNPHMHLLEATLAMYDTTKLDYWLERSNRLVALFENQFFDYDSGSLGEFFNENWSPAPGHAGEWREPGHLFEWVWLLFEYHRLSGEERVIPLADRLFQFATRFGIDTRGPLSGFVFNGVDRRGNLLEDAKLLWPQTEYIKANVARARWLGDEAAGQMALAHLKQMREHYFKMDGATWYNELSRTGEPLNDETPARILYHVFLAVAETMKLPSVGITDP